MTTGQLHRRRPGAAVWWFIGTLTAANSILLAVLVYAVLLPKPQLVRETYRVIDAEQFVLRSSGEDRAVLQMAGSSAQLLLYGQDGRIELTVPQRGEPIFSVTRTTPGGRASSMEVRFGGNGNPVLQFRDSGHGIRAVAGLNPDEAPVFCTYDNNGAILSGGQECDLIPVVD